MDSSTTNNTMNLANNNSVTAPIYNSTNATNGYGGSETWPEHVIGIQDWCLVAAFIIIMISGVAGNLLVIYVFGKKKNKRSVDLLTLNLGIVDLMASIFNPPLNIYWILTNFQKWHLGDLGCKILPAIGPTMTTASGWVLLIFAVERYNAIVKPFSSRFSQKVIMIACLASVLGSAAMYVPYVHGIQKEYGKCTFPDPRIPEYGYPNCAFIIVRLLAFIMIFSSTNIHIYRTLRKSKQCFSAKELREMRTKQSKRVMRTLSMMGIAFGVLVFPRELLYLIYNISDLIHRDCSDAVISLWLVQLNSWLKVMHTSNSCANIFIYANMQDTYKRQIRKIMEWVAVAIVTVSETVTSNSFTTRIIKGCERQLNPI